MARLAPFIILAVFGLLAFLGPKGKAFDNARVIECAYRLADLNQPASNILMIGSSRLGRGIDPGYMMMRIKARSGQDIAIERLALTFPTVPQFRPVMSRYIAHRGAPRHVVVQLIYNFREDRQREWDVPVNSTRNVINTPLAELIALRKTALLNDHGTVLPRQFEDKYLSLPALVLQKLEINVFAALRYPAKRLVGKDICAGDALYRQGNPNWHYNDISDAVAFTDSAALQKRRIRNLETVKSFLPLAPNAPFRQFETDQIKTLISTLESSGSSVSLMVMPALGDIALTSLELEEIATTFPGYTVLHPYSLFNTDVGADLAKSFADTHHATLYGALIYSRFFADIFADWDY